MLSQLTISLLAVTMTATSPLLHYWEHAVEMGAPAGRDCCDASHDATPDVPEQPNDDHQTCDCKYRVAVSHVPQSDIAELASKHLPSDHLLASDAFDVSTEFSVGSCFDTPVHFSLAADGGDLCARLGRYLI